MSKPILLTVDDDPEVLNAIARDLRHHFRSDYRVIKASSGAEALETIRQLKQRGAQIALFLVDERMPHMTGTQLLLEAVKLYPEARRVLLTAYADTATAITAINEVGLDHYLLKPWEPPSMRLYPVLEDLLSDWFARARPVFDGIRVAGNALSSASYTVKHFLASNHVPYQWLDVDADATVRELLSNRSDGEVRLPTVFFPDGTVLVQPELRELAEKAGLQTRAQKPFYDLIVVGGANSAGQGAMFFSRHARKVTVLVRGPDLSARMSRYLVDRIVEAPNIEVLVNTSVAAVRGNGRLEAVTVVGGERRDLPATAMFIFIGSAPRTEWCRNLVLRESRGFVLTGPDVMTNGCRPAGWTASRDPYIFETSVPGVFCAGVPATVPASASRRLWARARPQ